MESTGRAADLEREKSSAGGGPRREEGGDEGVRGADGNVAEPGDVEDLDGEGGGVEEVVVDREDEAIVPGGVCAAAVIDGGGEFVVRVDPRHRICAEEFGDGGQVLGR